MTSPHSSMLMVDPTLGKDYFRVERHGDVAVITPSSLVENMDESAIEQAADMLLSPLRSDPPAGLVIDLSEVAFFGSMFIHFLLDCHLFIKDYGSELVVAGVNERTRELLHITNLDTLWALYDTRAEALEALA